MTFALATPRAPLPDLRRMATDAPAFTILAILLALGLIPLYAAMALDIRVFQGESPWVKPVKFHYALGVYTITLAFLARYLPDATRAGRPWRWFTTAVVVAIVGEVAWLSAAAMQNTASHFNTEVPLFTAIYPLMGAFATLLTSASLVMGILIWRNRATGLAPAMHLAVALGLILTFARAFPGHPCTAFHSLRRASGRLGRASLGLADRLDGSRPLFCPCYLHLRSGPARPPLPALPGLNRLFLGRPPRYTPRVR